MRLKNYGRNFKQSKVYIQIPGLFMVEKYKGYPMISCALSHQPNRFSLSIF
jgi:hypothetical protein